MLQTAIAVPILIGISLALYFSGQVNNEGLIRGLVLIVFVVAFAYMFQYVIRDVLSKDKQLRVAKFGYIMIGMGLGIIFGYFGTGFILIVISNFTGRSFTAGNPLHSLFWSFPIQFFGLILAPMIGVTLAYQIGKKRRFKTPNYNPDLEN
ncbi:MAG: hypothetical protein ACQCN3_11980 [Candidatus Bathyarchaeia archaeon]